MRRAWWLVLATGTAHAEPPRIPIGLTATVGAGQTFSGDAYGNSDRNHEYGATIDLGFRPSPAAMIGIHVALGSDISERFFIGDTMSDQELEYAFHRRQYGISGLYMVNDRFHISGWAGVQRGYRGARCERETSPSGEVTSSCGAPQTAPDGGTPIAFGAAVGFDPLIVGDHRLTIELSYSYAFENPDPPTDGLTYTTLGVAVGYRFWAR